jgi:hypothetical protein
MIHPGRGLTARRVKTDNAGRARMSGATTRMRQTEAEATPDLPFLIAAWSCGSLIKWCDFYLYPS